MPILSLSNQFCQLNNIQNEAELEMKIVGEQPTDLIQVIIDPYDEQDYEILESNQLLVQNSFLHQIRIVQKDTAIVVFCQNLPIRLRIGK